MREQVRFLVVALIAALAAALLPAAAVAAKGKPTPRKAGTLDRSFSDDGVLTSTLSDGGTVHLALGPDGEIAVARGAAVPQGSVVLEYDPDGRRRREFGENGRLLIEDPGGSLFGLTGIALDSTGRLLVGGTSYGEMMAPPFPQGTNLWRTAATVARYSGRGHLDGSFGEAGYFRSDLGLPRPTTAPPGPGADGQTPTYTYPGTSLEASGISVDARGRVAITGSAVTEAHLCYPGSYERFTDAFVAQLTESGSLDPAFASTGVVSDPRYEFAAAPRFRADGRLFVFETSGRCLRGSHGSGALVMRRGGFLDGAYGEGGYADLGPLAESPSALAAANASGLAFVLYPSEEYWYRSLGRFLPNGQPDGKVKIERWDKSSPELIGIDARGRALVVGRKRANGGYTVLRVERFTPDGLRDSSFGRRGVSSVAFQQGQVKPTAIGVDARGRILVAGQYFPPGDAAGSELFVVRLRGR